MLLFLFSLFFLLASPAKAQDVEQYQADYQYQLDLYQKSYQDYLEKDQVDQKYSTLNTQKDKTDSAIVSLLQRNQLLYSYLILNRVNLDQSNFNQNPETTALQEKLLEKETWLKAQDLNIKQLSHQDQVNKWSTQFKTQYNDIQKLTYSSVVQIQINRQRNILQKLQILGQEVQSDSPDNQALNQWLNELPTKSDLVNKYLNQAFLTTQKKQNSNRFNNFYPEATRELDKSKLLLEEIQSNLKSVISKFINP